METVIGLSPAQVRTRPLRLQLRPPDFIIYTPGVCQELAITTSHCHVILRRARMGLRLCLDQRWFTLED